MAIADTKLIYKGTVHPEVLTVITAVEFFESQVDFTDTGFHRKVCNRKTLMRCVKPTSVCSHPVKNEVRSPLSHYWVQVLIKFKDVSPLKKLLFSTIKLL